MTNLYSPLLSASPSLTLVTDVERVTASGATAAPGLVPDFLITRAFGREGYSFLCCSDHAYARA